MICLLILERDRERERDRQTDIDWLPSLCSLTGDQTCNLGMCPDGELNPRPSGVWDNQLSHLARVTELPVLCRLEISLYYLNYLVNVVAIDYLIKSSF